MNIFNKTFKLLWHNIIYFLILNFGYNFFCMGIFKYSLFNSYYTFIAFITLMILLSTLTYFFLIKTLENKKNSIILLLILLLSLAFCMSPIPIGDGLIPNIWGNKIHFFFYDFFPTWYFINQLLYLMSHIYQYNLDKNIIK